MSNKTQNPYIGRAHEAAQETDAIVNLDLNMTAHMTETLAQPDRETIRILIDRIQQASDANNRNAILSSSLLENGEVVLRLLKAVVGWLK